MGRLYDYENMLSPQSEKEERMNRLQRAAWNQPWVGQNVERAASAQLKKGWAVGLSLNK